MKWLEAGAGRGGEGSFCRYRANICDVPQKLSGSASVSGRTVKITKISRNCKMKLKHLGAKVQLSSGNNLACIDVRRP